MAKKIILTEEQFKRIASSINEDFDSHIYDLVLDMYNEYGLGGMAEDEIAYLKSGGETNIPVSLREPEKNYDLGNEDNDGDEETQIREVSELLDVVDYEKKRSDTHILFLFNYSDNVYDELIRIFGGVILTDNFGNTIKIKLIDKNAKIALVLPLSWEDKLFGEGAQ
jgi:hypothetical protein